MRWRRTVVIGRVEPRAVTPALAGAIARLRQLQVDDGVVLHPDDGQPIGRMRVTAGTWPSPGARFMIARRELTDAEVTARVEHLRTATRATAQGGRPAVEVTDGRVREALAARQDLTGEIVADGRDCVELTWTADGRTRQRLVVESPGAPTMVTTTSTSPGGNSCLTRGVLTIETRVDVAAVAARASGRPVATVEVRHRRFVLHGRVDATFRSSGTTLAFEARARGAGLVRPLAAVIGFVTTKAMAKSLGEALDEWQADGTPPIGPFVGRVDPDAIAAELVRGVLSIGA